MKSNTKFQLNKWYLDCVSATGQTVIGYSAALAWRSLAFSYASYLSSDVLKKKSSKTSILHEHLPEITPQKIIHWKSDGLSCSGHWTPLSPEPLPPLRLYEDETGFISWHCLQPLSNARVQLQAQTINGLGYVEQLEITIPPWKLPIRELHWGRFLSENIYLVWIEWRGAYPLSLVFLKGKKIESTQISPNTLIWHNGSLQLYSSRVLRSGPLVHTALSKIPGVNSLFPGRILYTREFKWRSFGKLVHKGTSHTGWAIHEIVQFGLEKHETSFR